MSWSPTVRARHTRIQTSYHRTDGPFSGPVVDVTNAATLTGEPVVSIAFQSATSARQATLPASLVEMDPALAEWLGHTLITAAKLARDTSMYDPAPFAGKDNPNLPPGLHEDDDDEDFTPPNERLDD